tara:strand:+ start:20475 stop:20840 length:366 start_codon:yes stop_codon:yes gene_type:complete
MTQNPQDVQSDKSLPQLILKMSDWIDIKPSSTFDTLKLVIQATDDELDNERLSDIMDILIEHKSGYEWKFLDRELDDPDMTQVVTRHLRDEVSSGNIKAYRHIAAIYVYDTKLKDALRDIL